VKCIFTLILVLIIFKHPKYRIKKSFVDMCARDGRGQWRAEGGTNGATAPGIQGRDHRKSEIRKIKMPRLDDFSYCDATNTCCMDL